MSFHRFRSLHLASLTLALTPLSCAVVCSAWPLSPSNMKDPFVISQRMRSPQQVEQRTDKEFYATEGGSYS